MRQYDLSHLSNTELLQNLSTLIARDRETTANLLAHLAEVDARRLYADIGHSSMFTYCVKGLHLSEDSAAKRIHACRAARKFPALLAAFDQGKLHLAAMCVLAPHLTDGNVHTLIEAATRKGRTEIEAWLAAHSMTASVPMRPCTIRPVVIRAPEGRDDAKDMFSGIEAPGEPELLEDDERDVSSSMSLQHAPGHVEMSSDLASGLAPAPSFGPSSVPSSEPSSPPSPGSPSFPALPEHYRMQVTIARDTHDKLRRAQALLGHAVPSGDVAEVLDRALDLLIKKLESRKFGARASRRSRRFPRRESPSARYVLMQVRRAVWERDQGRCTFISAGGERCGEQTRLEYDHIVPVARGGAPSVANVRLRCRAHNQLEAKRVFGSAFMQGKRRGTSEP